MREEVWGQQEAGGGDTVAHAGITPSLALPSACEPAVQGQRSTAQGRWGILGLLASPLAVMGTADPARTQQHSGREDGGRGRESCFLLV